jgi:phospholipase/carboxylesterase
MQATDTETAYLKAALQAAHAARDLLAAMERTLEQLAPERVQRLAEETAQHHGSTLTSAHAALDAAAAPADLQPFAQRFADAFGEAETTFTLFTSLPTAPIHERIPRILGAMHHLARAQEAFYALREPLSPFADYWNLPGVAVLEAPGEAGDATARTGVVHVGAGGHHGGFSLYIPETYTPARPWPVIVALHGGSGNGRDFLWTWVREAKSLQYILVAPSAVGDTWGPLEDRGLLEVLSWMSDRYRLAADRILLTGLSDGATFALLYGLAHPEVYRALAPLCGVLHPANEALGNLERARGMPIYLVHGAQDFLFPVSLARDARDTLAAAGADLVYREIPELSHTYPRSENVRVLRWFEALPERPSS